MFRFNRQLPFRWFPHEPAITIRQDRYVSWLPRDAVYADEAAMNVMLRLLRFAYLPTIILTLSVLAYRRESVRRIVYVWVFGVCVCMIFVCMCVGEYVCVCVIIKAIMKISYCI